MLYVGSVPHDGINPQHDQHVKIYMQEICGYNDVVVREMGFNIWTAMNRDDAQERGYDV